MRAWFIKSVTYLSLHASHVLVTYSTVQAKVVLNYQPLDTRQKQHHKFLIIWLLQQYPLACPKNKAVGLMLPQLRGQLSTLHTMYSFKISDVTRECFY